MSAHFIRLNLLLGTEIVQILSDIQAAMLSKLSILDRPMCAARIFICSTTAAIHLLWVTLRLLVMMREALLVISDMAANPPDSHCRWINRVFVWILDPQTLCLRPTTAFPSLLTLCAYLIDRMALADSFSVPVNLFLLPPPKLPWWSLCKSFFHIYD